MAMLWLLFRRFRVVFLYRRSVVLIQVMNHPARAAEQASATAQAKAPHYLAIVRGFSVCWQNARPALEAYGGTACRAPLDVYLL